MLEVIVKKCVQVEDDDDEEEVKEESKDPHKNIAPSINLLRKKVTLRNVMSHKIMFMSKVSSLLKKTR